MNNTDNKRSPWKIILIVSAIVFAVAAAIVGVYFFVNKKIKKAKSIILGKLDFDGDGEIDAIMLDTTGNGEVDTIILNSDTCKPE